MREMVRLMRNKRFRKIFLMFFRFFMQFWWLGKTKRFVSKEKNQKRYSKVYRAQGEKFTTTAVELGGLIIKLGQFVSSRVDILPKEYTEALSVLQDSVAPVASDIAITRIEAELSGTIELLFKNFDRTPVAAASLGQVHKAVLQNGENVAVKVMRPGIEEIVALDLKTFKILMAFAQRFTKVEKMVDLSDVYQEFKEVVTEELDYQKEANHLEKFCDNFIDFPGITVPAVYRELSTSKVLVMEFIDGVKINEMDQLKEMKVNKRKLASALYLSYIKQLLEDGFFHADPHPGNLLVKNDGTLAYIDFGMVGKISNDMKENMVKLALAVYMKDAGGIVDAFEKLGFLRKQADKAALRKNVKLILSSFSDGGFSFESLQDESVLDELREFLYEQPFQIPSRTTFLGKAIMTVFSLCNGLDDKFDMLSLTKPYVEELMTSGSESPVKDTVLDQVKETVLNIVPAVRKVTQLIDQMESGELKLSPPKSFEKGLYEQQSRQTRRLVLALFGTGLLISGAQILAQSETAGIILMVVGAVFTLLQAARTGQGRRRLRRRHPSFKAKS
jgi:predicted unusual protein kinase regulating ubiquinone biosynthesis (AarF/ABC1/UbiB family)